MSRRHERVVRVTWLYRWGGTGFAAALFVLFGLFDVWASPLTYRRRLGPVTGQRWYAPVLLLPVLGTLLWIAYGRPSGAAKSTQGRTARGPRTGRPGRAGRPAAGPSRRGEPGRLASVHPFPTSVEETNASIERSRELNRRLEEWEAQQRKGAAPDSTSGPASSAGRAAKARSERRPEDVPPDSSGPVPDDDELRRLIGDIELPDDLEGL